MQIAWKLFGITKYSVCFCQRLMTWIEKAYAQTVEEDFFARADRNITSLIGLVDRTDKQNLLLIKFKFGAAQDHGDSDKFSSVLQSYQALQEILHFFILIFNYLGFFTFANVFDDLESSNCPTIEKVVSVLMVCAGDLEDSDLKLTDDSLN